MFLFPAIDLSGGKVVRLVQGDYNRLTVYGDDPAMAARNFQAAGARHLHVVDLDGAKAGHPVNTKAVKAIASVGLETELGGGIRTEEDIKTALDAGISRVILGTAAAQNRPFLTSMAKQFPGHIAAGVDARNGIIAVNGWLQDTGIEAMDFCRQLVNSGIDTVIYTDIAKDGNGGGTNLEAYRRLSCIRGLRVIASGGITYEKEISTLSAMGMYGAIIGKALYTGALSLERLLILTGELPRKGKT